MQDNTPVAEMVFLPLVNTIHFYASLIAGWWGFHIGVYPVAYFARNTDIAAQLPIYAINVLAFGCMVYVATRPVALLITTVIRAFERLVAKDRDIK